jgi:hypothetical protein
VRRLGGPNSIHPHRIDLTNSIVEQFCCDSTGGSRPRRTTVTCTSAWCSRKRSSWSASRTAGTATLAHPSGEVHTLLSLDEYTLASVGRRRLVGRPVGPVRPRHPLPLSPSLTHPDRRRQLGCGSAALTPERTYPGQRRRRWRGDSMGPLRPRPPTAPDLSWAGRSGWVWAGPENRTTPRDCFLVFRRPHGIDDADTRQPLTPPDRPTPTGPAIPDQPIMGRTSNTDRAPAHRGASCWSPAATG